MNSRARPNFAVYRASKSAVAAVEKVGGTVKILAPPKQADAEPRGKNKRKALEAAKGGGSKGGKPKAASPRRKRLANKCSGCHRPRKRAIQ